MASVLTKVPAVAAVILWLFVCVWIYRRFRRAAWLAGASVSCCLFFLGATIVACFFVPRAILLVPLALAIVVLLTVHLVAAQRDANQKPPPNTSTPENSPFSEVPSPGSASLI